MPLPFRAEMERSFGVSFSDVKAYSDEPARAAAQALNAKAFTVGNRIAFSTSSPDRGLVAHELTHVVQARSKGASSVDERGIETAGEAQADRVELAVASGQPARAALEAGGGASTVAPPVEAGGGDRPTTAARRLPPSLKSGGFDMTKLVSGMAFDKNSFEASREFELWKGEAIPLPAPLPPPFELSVKPSLSVTLAGGYDWNSPTVQANAGIEGGVALKLSYGLPPMLSIYAEMDAKATGGFMFERTRKPGPGKDKWSLNGELALETNFAVGVEIGGEHKKGEHKKGEHEKACDPKKMQRSMRQRPKGHHRRPAKHRRASHGEHAGKPAPRHHRHRGPLHLPKLPKLPDLRFEFGKIEVGKLSGISFSESGFHREPLNWEWGPQIKKFFQKIKSLVHKIKKLF